MKVLLNDGTVGSVKEWWTGSEAIVLLSGENGCPIESRGSVVDILDGSDPVLWCGEMTAASCCHNCPMDGHCPCGGTE